MTWDCCICQIGKKRKNGTNCGGDTNISDEVESALENLSARGLFISTKCETEEMARVVLKNCEKWSKDRKIK